MGLPYKLLLSTDNTFKTVDEIPALTANAIHPESENKRFYCAINHKAALLKAINAGMVTPLNPLSYEQHTFPFGDALKNAVISLADLKRFAETLQIEVVIGDEPVPRQDDVASTKTHLTIDKAASALAEKYGFNENTTKTMKTQLMDAAESGDLIVRHPHTLLPYRPDTKRDFYELVSLSDLNAWFKTQGVEYQLHIEEPEQVLSRPSDDVWITKARAIADRIGLEKFRAGIQQITARNICDAVATELSLDKTTWGLQGPRSTDNVRNAGLRAWKFTPPKEAQKVD